MSRSQANRLRSKLKGKTKDMSRHEFEAERNQLIERVETLEQMVESLSRSLDALSRSHNFLLEESHR
jgi:exonuclease VII small subunit